MNFPKFQTIGLLNSLDVSCIMTKVQLLLLILVDSQDY